MHSWQVVLAFEATSTPYNIPKTSSEPKEQIEVNFLSLGNAIVFHELYYPDRFAATFLKKAGIFRPFAIANYNRPS